jgi:hypothetical protein
MAIHNLNVLGEWLSLKVVCAELLNIPDFVQEVKDIE